jgi:predicted small lipoprotein YifL
MTRRQAAGLALVLIAAAAPLAACGKKGPPGLPAGEKSTYPRPYPSAAPQQNATPSVPGNVPDDEDKPADAQPAPAKPNP